MTTASGRYLKTGPGDNQHRSCSVVRKERTILLLELQQPDVSVLLEGVIVRWEVRDLCPERSWVFGERMQVQSVEYDVRNVTQT